MGNSIFTIRQGEALPYSTQSRETITREGGREGGLSGNEAEVSFLLMTCELKEEHKVFSLCTYSATQLHFSLCHCGNDQSVKIPAMAATDTRFISR